MNLYRILPICSLLFIACSDENSDSVFNAESENLMSSSWIASSSSNSRNDVNSSSTKLFDTRVPNQEALFCMDSTAYTVFKRYVEEKDLICSFEYDGDEGFVYVQSNPTKCIGSELTPVYVVHKAEFFVNGSKQEITDVKYNGGGSHGTYSIRFTYKGKVFDYGYSTMGMGGRPCQDVDCMNVYEADGKTLVQNGCVNRERSLPVVCRHAKKDGTFASFEDTYHICEYDIFGD